MKFFHLQIAMYENHTTKYCDNYSAKESSPFLNKDYFEILQVSGIYTYIQWWLVGVYIW